MFFEKIFLDRKGRRGKTSKNLAAKQKERKKVSEKLVAQIGLEPITHIYPNVFGFTMLIFQHDTAPCLLYLYYSILI